MLDYIYHHTLFQTVAIFGTWNHSMGNNRGRGPEVAPELKLVCGVLQPDGVGHDPPGGGRGSTQRAGKVSLGSRWDFDDIETQHLLQSWGCCRSFVSLLCGCLGFLWWISTAAAHAIVECSVYTAVLHDSWNCGDQVCLPGSYNWHVMGCRSER